MATKPADLGRITAFERKHLKTIGELFLAAIKPVADKLGLTVEYGGGSFDEAEFRIKFVAKVGDAEKRVFEKLVDMFNVFDPKTPLTAGDYKRRLKYGTDKREWELVGIKPGNKKDIIISDVATGKLATGESRWMTLL